MYSCSIALQGHSRFDPGAAYSRLLACHRGRIKDSQEDSSSKTIQRGARVCMGGWRRKHAAEDARMAAFLAQAVTRIQVLGLYTI